MVHKLVLHIVSAKNLRIGVNVKAISFKIWLLFYLHCIIQEISFDVKLAKDQQGSGYLKPPKPFFFAFLVPKSFLFSYLVVIRLGLGYGH